ncbi:MULTISPECIES: NAD(P)/FAD-dependent oxidoreductase [unclassified Acinetobacter]|uniref:NAD(P)/FAD-dependent oxidoreductase n=1 Tax=unclassified Acinetobacter TaxID=196816 RepID=UPI0035BB38A2
MHNSKNTKEKKVNKNQYDVIIIGAGASGLMCAIQAGKRGRKVLILEKANKVGKKILMSGGGKCNFTNLDVQPENYICHNPYFVISALSQYTQWDFIGMVADYQIEYEQRDLGKLFTLNGAKDILNMLLAECDKTKNVEILCHINVEQAEFQNHQFIIHTSQQTFSCQSLVIASGGLSIPTLGGSGVGYQIAKDFGHQVYPTRAGLVPFTFSDKFKNFTESLSGIAIDATLSNHDASFNEALLFTHRGLSGPSSLQLSNYWHLGEEIQIDFLPQIDLKELFLAKKQTQPKIVLRTILSEFLPKNMVLQLQQLLWQDIADKPLAEINNQKLAQLAEQLHGLAVKPSGTEGYRTAEVTLGGVDCDEVSSQDMQSLKQKGLYFIGEVLDVTGHLGGYNFQWAWSSGFVAGQSI